MKSTNSKEEFNSYPPSIQLFLVFWLEGKQYPVRRELTTDQWRELAEALGMVEKDTSIERKRNDSESAYFDNVMDLGEVIFAWNGDELIDILSYKVRERVKKRMNQAK